MNNPKVNVVVGGHKNDYHSTYKTYILRGGVDFASQVIMPNTKYVVKHDFDLGGGAFDIDFTNADTHTVAEVTYYYIPFTADGSKYTLIDDTLVFIDAEWNGLSAREIKPEKGTLFMIASITGGLHKKGYGINVVTVPENCILEFDGGSLDNGVIIGQNTVFINVGDVKIWGDNLIRLGTWKDHSGGEEAPIEMVMWYMLDNESNNRDNSTDYCMRYAGSKSMLSLTGLEEVYFNQNVKDLQPIFDKNYIIGVKFQWYNENGTWIQTDDYVNLNTSDGHFAIPNGAENGYVTFNLTLTSHQAAIFKEVVEAAEIYTNIIGKSRLIYNQNTPTKWMADEDRYKNSLYIPNTVITRLGYSKWRIGDDPVYGENSVWLEQYEGLVSDYIIDLGKFKEYNAIVVDGDDNYRCWFTFVTKYPEVVGEKVQQSSIYGSSYFVHVYVLPKQVLTRVIPDDAKYLVVSWRHGTDEQLTATTGYYHPKSIRFINTNVNTGALSYAKKVNDEFTAMSYPILAASVNRNTNRLNELRICSWNIGHWSMGVQPYSTITQGEEDAKKAAVQSFLHNNLKDPDIMLFNEYEVAFSPSYKTASVMDYRMQWSYFKDRYCCQAIYSNVFIQLVDIVYFPYSIYLVTEGFGDAMDYFCVYRTYINDHAITIASVHLRSDNETMNMRQCNYLINHLSGYSHVLIVGDFNREDMSVFTNAGYTVKITSQTHEGGESVDHFAYKGVVQLSLEAVYPTDLSDHYPIVARITTTDNIKITGASNERPSYVGAGFRYFDTTLNKPVFKTEFGFWVDADGNPIDGWWKTLGTLELTSEEFDEDTVVVTQNTYTSTWVGWTNKVDNTIYRNTYVIEGDPFAADDTIEISIIGAERNIEWNLAYLNSNDEPVIWLLNEDETPTYNVDKRIIKIPQHENVAKLRLGVSCDIKRFDGKIVINKRM